MDQRKPPLKVLEVCKISPSPSPAAEFSLPLTFLDLLFIRSPPTERILFYSFAAEDDFHWDSILPKLKQSLSLTLSHFLPLAGNLAWPDDSPEPIILYKPGDAVSLIIAQTDAADFDRLAADHIRKATESHFLVPKLEEYSDTVIPAMCLQITLFPSCGFSIGIITNHLVVDGKMSTLFLKSWASISKFGLPALPPELTPVFDRTALKDPAGIESLFGRISGKFFSNPNSPGKKLRLVPKVVISDDVFKGTFELTGADIKNLRTKAAASLSSSTRHLTTFVLMLAHVSTCMIKAEPLEAKKSKIGLVFPVDLRPRLGTPVETNYFGNGACFYGLIVEAREFEEEKAMGIISSKIGDAIAELEEMVKEKRLVQMLDGFFVRWTNESPISKTIVVAGSPRFELYDTDFGWGGCKKVEMTSGKPGETFSIMESRNGDGGLEVGMALPKDAMDVFCSLFTEGLKQS